MLDCSINNSRSTAPFDRSTLYAIVHRRSLRSISRRHPLPVPSRLSASSRPYRSSKHQASTTIRRPTTSTMELVPTMAPPRLTGPRSISVWQHLVDEHPSIQVDVVPRRPKSSATRPRHSNSSLSTDFRPPETAAFCRVYYVTSYSLRYLRLHQLVTQ